MAPLAVLRLWFLPAVSFYLWTWWWYFFTIPSKIPPCFSQSNEIIHHNFRWLLSHIEDSWDSASFSSSLPSYLLLRQWFWNYSLLASVTLFLLHFPSWSFLIIPAVHSLENPPHPLPVSYWGLFFLPTFHPWVISYANKSSVNVTLTSNQYLRQASILSQAAPLPLSSLLRLERVHKKGGRCAFQNVARMKMGLKGVPYYHL